MKDRRWTGWLWASPWLVGSGVFLLLPMAMSLYLSFTDYPLIESPLWAGLSNYRRMFEDEKFWMVVRNTALYTVLTVPVCTVASLVLAALLNRAGRWSRFVQAVVFVPTLVPLMASAMVWLWLFNGDRGLINRLIALVGVQGPNWLIDRHWVMPSLVIMSLWSVGQAVVVYIAALQDVPESLYEAAKLDGMGPVRQFVSVTLPMVSPVVLFNIITLTINQVQVFAVPYVMFRRPDGQNPAGYFFTQYLYENAFVYGQMGYASALAWVQLLAVLGLTGLMLLASRKLVYYRA
ncbi:MAG: carbohydrate ABC transporter permease [Phycisphaerales bacterium]